MTELWYVQYKFEGRWYESAYALKAGLYEYEAREAIGRHFVPETYDSMRIWKSGYADKAVCVQRPRRIQARHVRSAQVD